MEKKIKLLILVKKKFRPEFLNRLDEVIIFNKLTEKDLQQIIRKELFEFQARLEEKKYILIFPPILFLTFY